MPFLIIMVNLDTETMNAGLAEGMANLALASQTALLRVLFAYYPVRFCASALCTLLAVSGLDGMETVSPWLVRARRWFAACILMNAVAMTVRVVRVSLINAGAIERLDVLTPAVQAVAIALLGAAQVMLLRGYRDVLESIGAIAQARRAVRLSNWTAWAFGAFVVTYFMFVADLFTVERFSAPVAAMLIAIVVSFLIYIAVRIQVTRCARQVWRTLAAISDEVIS